LRPDKTTTDIDTLDTVRRLVESTETVIKRRSLD
jgi:hypothetical protein